tara:strand:- start:143 stop:253 length:111 start_codon:yes stop_codon:yes gene_type:complete
MANRAGQFLDSVSGYVETRKSMTDDKTDGIVDPAEP